MPTPVATRSQSRRRALDADRRRGLSRVGPITTGVVLAGGAATLTVAVALGVTRPANAVTPPSTGGAGSGSSAGSGASVPQTRHHRHDDGGGSDDQLAPVGPDNTGSQQNGSQQNGSQGGTQQGGGQGGGLLQGGGGPPAGVSQGS